jgi:predicted aldo/keto reductase-like oxidoreductase
MYGINCIEDIERIGQNVWDRGGMIEFLQRQKDAGRLGGIFCTTHAPSEYVEHLISSGVFDAVMVAYNPLGFHQLSYSPAREGRTFENLSDTRARIFQVAAAHGVSLLIMKPLAGGLLVRGKAFPPHAWFAPSDGPSATDVLKSILTLPAVCAVVPGVASVAEAEEDARAGYAAPFAGHAAVDRAAAEMRTSICSRCGDCEPTCSRGLAISSMFRDAYIWSSGNETFMAADHENYFSLHPDTTLACATCVERTCECSQGIEIPAALARVHEAIAGLRNEGRHPGPVERWSSSIVRGHHQVLVLSRDVPSRADAGTRATARFLLENAGDRMWAALAHNPDPHIAVAVGVTIGGHLVESVPLRQNICAEQRSPVAFEFAVPSIPGDHELRMFLLPVAAADASARATEFHASRLTIVDGHRTRAHEVVPMAHRAGAPVGPSVDVTSRARRAHAVVRRATSGIARRTARLIRHGRAARPEPVYGVKYTRHSIPERLLAGETYGVRVTLENTGTFTWESTPADQHPVAVFVQIDDTVFSVLDLPCAAVVPGGGVTLHFALRAPSAAGVHRVRIDAVHQHVAWFADRGAPPLVVQVDVATSTPTESARLTELALAHNLWFYLPTQGIAASRDGRTFPLFVSRAKGCRIWDGEDREYIDYTMGWGSTILGYADDRVQAAIRGVLDTAPVTPFPHPLEMEVSQLLVEDFAPAEMVVFGKNGSDVCTVAARLARLATGKRVILS